MGVLLRDVGMNNIMIFRAGAETVDVLIDYDPSRITNQYSSFYGSRSYKGYPRASSYKNRH
jgi:hypothetical protein